MKPLYAIAMLSTVLISWSASAETTVTSRSCRSSTYGPSTCTTVSKTTNDSEPTTQKQMSQAEERKYWEEKDARIRRWEEFCKPTGVTDNMGITRLRYAHEGCDLGRSGENGPVAQMRE